MEMRLTGVKQNRPLFIFFPFNHLSALSNQTHLQTCRELSVGFGHVVQGHELRLRLELRILSWVQGMTGR